MDKTEQLADMVILAAQAFIEKKLAPIMEALASVKRELDVRGFMTKDDAAAMFAGAGIELRIEELREQIKAQPIAPTLDQVKAEAGAAALEACTKLLEAIPKPADGKSVTMAEVMPEIERLVAEIPRPNDGKDADPDDVAAEVTRQIALVPPPQDGKSVDLGAIFTEIGGAVQRAVAELPKPADGKSVTLDDVRPLIEKGITDAVAEIPRPEDGKSVSLDEVKELVGEAVAAIPKPQDGKSVDLDELYGSLDKWITDRIAELPPPADGKSVTPEELKQAIFEALDAIPPLPPPVDGKSVTPEDMRPMLAEMVAAIPKPADGKDADLAMLNELVTVSVKAAMAEFRPPDKGDPGKDADPVDMDEVRRFMTAEIVRELATWEHPQDGKDGLGFDDMTMDLEEDGRTMVFRFSRDGREKRFEIVCPWQIYRDVYKAGQSYQRGDQVTYGGSQHTAKRDTDKPPGTDDWTLSTKRGKDGKDAH